MPEMEGIPDALFYAFGELVFGETDLPQAVAVAGTNDLLKMTRARFGRPVATLIEKVEAEPDRARDFARALAVMALRAHFHSAMPTLDDEQKAKLHEELLALQENDPRAISTALRAVAQMTVDGDLDRAAPVFRLAEAIGGTSEPDGPQSPDTGGDPDMENFDEIIAKLDLNFAFDEAKLPARLHYTTGTVTDANGNTTTGQVLSDGQKNFLIGSLEALQKLGADVSPDNSVFVAGAIGLLLLDGHHDPDDRSFFEHVTEAHTELLEPASATRPEIISGDDKFQAQFDQKRAVFVAVGELLLRESRGSKVFFDAFAAVSRGMADTYDTRPPGSAGFGPAVFARYNDETLAAGGGDGGGSGIAFLDLPPLNDPAGESDEIVPENIDAVAAIYVVYQCEQMMLFKCVERIVELFMAGLLPMGGDALARKLDTYYWDREDHVSENGRQANYARALGAPGGNVGPDAPRNDEFSMHQMRCVSTIAAVQSEKSYANLFDQTGLNTTLTKSEYARKALRDWAANCTLYGYAGAQFAAERLGRQLRQAIEILQLPRIKEIYGVNTMWQVIERVAQAEFGITVNVVKHRTLADETRAIMGVLADKHHIWSQSSGRPLFTVNKEPGDLDRETSERLFRSAQYFLAVNGVQDTNVRDYSQPVETPALPSVPAFGAFGGGGAMPNAGAGGDVAGQIKDLLGRGITPSPEQLKNIVGVI